MPATAPATHGGRRKRTARMVGPGVPAAKLRDAWAGPQENVATRGFPDILRRMTTRSIPILASLVALSLAGCARDPSKDAPAAEVKDAASPAATAPAGGDVKGVTLPIDTTRSKLNWEGSKVTKTHPGGFKTFSGSILLVDGKPEASKVDIEIDVASLWSDSERLEGHLRSEDFFEVAKFPKASFTSTSITAGGAEGATHTVRGNLTMRGVTKEISFPATITVGEKEVAAKAKFAINRKDWGIVYPGAPDDLIRDNVLIDWDIVAPRG